MVSSRPLLALATAALFAAPAMAGSLALPDRAPLPSPGEQPATLPSDPPVPQQKPAGHPTQQEPDDAGKEPEKKARQPDSRSDLRPIDPMPKQEAACRQRLKALGVAFEERKPIHDEENGCSVPYPLTVGTLGAGIDLAPAAEMNCQMAEAAARFVAETVAAMAKADLGAGLKSVQQASAYVCRPRHNGEKMSEHAFGNALDIAGFTLTDGSRVAVEPKPAGKNAGFLHDVRKAACGPFRTVLGPGSDPDHERHLHLDLQPRRGGASFCQ